MGNKVIFHEAKYVLLQVFDCINQLDYDQYNCSIELLSKATIGQHCRHIVEFFQALLDGYDSGCINYDNRKRNPLIETNISIAREEIASIISSLVKPDKEISIVSLYSSQDELISSSYLREVLFNLEHCIHHQSSIKIGFSVLNLKLIDPTFGLNKSTLKFRDKCAQ